MMARACVNIAMSERLASLNAPVAGRGAVQARVLRRAGFTLLELVVVIFIMILLATLAVASFHKFLETERIRLAGGAVDSAVRMARQYAMSKRTQCMIEFVSPDTDTTETVSVSPLQITSVRDRAFADVVQPAGSMRVQTRYTHTTADLNFRGFAMFDLSSLDVAGATDVTLEAIVLRINVGAVGTTFDNIDVKSVTSDAWDQSTITWNNQPAAGNQLASVHVDAAGSYDMDITDHVIAEYAGDKKVSLRFSVPNASPTSTYYAGVTATLEVRRRVSMPASAEEDIVHRQVRIIPYRRVINVATGGFSWLLDCDANALATTDLPRNIHYVLTPALAAVPQYDPADLDDKRAQVSKRFLVLAPDGTCSGAAPAVKDDPIGAREHWRGFTNTVILRDANNDDLCLLYVPPATSFTRQRYLFAGTELDDFEAAHAPYALW